MPALLFSKWSPGGNTTLLFPAEGLSPRQQTALGRQALDPQNLGGEQAAFTDVRQLRLRMAGGEFCLNACRAFGALLSMGQEPKRQSDSQREGAQADIPSQYRHEIHVSGWQSPVRLHTRGCTPLWQVEAALSLPACAVESPGPGLKLVRLPGISHLLLNTAMHDLPEDYEAAALHWRQRCRLEQEPAVGTIWWGERQGQLDMIPLVHVRDARTTFLENSCGSGALALALSLSRAGSSRSFSIMQPGGSSLDVRLFTEGGQDMAAVDGPVSLVAQGQLWLPDDLA